MRRSFERLLPLLVLSSAAFAQLYQATPLRSSGRGSPQNGLTVALGLNDAGIVVGTYILPNSSRHVCYWSPTGAVTDVGTLGGTYGVGFGINNLKQIVGQSTTAGDAQTKAFIWSEATGMQSLPSLGLGIQDRAYAINDNSEVVGFSCLGSECIGDYHAFRWTQSGGIHDLGTLPGGTETIANAINAVGHIVGSVNFSDGSARAFLWTPGTGMRELAPNSGLKNYGASAINNSDQVIGSFLNSTDGEGHAFSWTSGTGIEDLGTLEGGWSEALAINDSGDIVGFGRNAAQTDGFELIWRPGTPIQELGPLAGTYLNEAATGISTSGQIAANGDRPLLLTPTWVELSTHQLSFGSWPVGQTSTVKTVTLTNIATTPLTINRIGIGGTNPGDFAEVNNCGSSVAPSASCIIQVTFKPTATGLRTALVRVADSDRVSPQRIKLSGTGI